MGVLVRVGFGLFGLAVLVLFALTPLVSRGRRWVIPLAYFYACVHIVNGLGHLGLSVATQRWIPGVLSSPLLVAAGAWLLIETGRVRHRVLALRPSGSGSR